MKRRKRNSHEICTEYSKYWDKVWWNRHMHDVQVAGHMYRDRQAIGQNIARDIEDRHSQDFLNPGDDLQWGICLGKMMALAWVLGAEWDEAGDT